MARPKLKKQSERRVPISATLAKRIKDQYYKYCKDNHIKSISKLTEVIIVAFLDRVNNNSNIDLTDRMYSKQELISFGNYLLSEERKEGFILTMQESMKQVHDSDIYNAFGE